MFRVEQVPAFAASIFESQVKEITPACPEPESPSAASSKKVVLNGLIYIGKRRYHPTSPLSKVFVQIFSTILKKSQKLLLCSIFDPAFT